MKKIAKWLRISMLILCAITISLVSCLTSNTNSKKNRPITERNNPEQAYSVYLSFSDLINARDSKYPKVVRITDGGSSKNPTYHGFFFYSCSPLDQLQFDPKGRYMLGMSVSFEGREVRATDRGEIGIIDLKDNNKWTRIGQTTAWNWQQGCRMGWIPGSSKEVIWDDRSDDGKSFVSHIFNTRTKEMRTLPRPIYTVSPDGFTALTHDFERMEHGGTNFVGLQDKYRNIWAPEGTGIWRMDIRNGKSVKIVSVRQMARLMYPDNLPSDTLGGLLYIFREGFNHSGRRLIVFVKDVRRKSQGETKIRTVGYSMTPEGKDIRYLYEEPSHHYWIDDETIMDNVDVVPPGGGDPLGGYYVFKDDGTGKPKKMLWTAPNGHDVYHPGGNWIITDTYSTNDPGENYNLNGYEYLYMYHIPTKKFVALGKFEYRIGGRYSNLDPGIYRVDLHPRLSPDGRSVSFDSTHEGLGRQIYLVDIGYILDHPPGLN
jgi:hypothetical protein